MVKCERFDRWTLFPGGKIAALYGRQDACRYSFSQL